MVCGNFILPEPASYVFFYAFSNLRNLLYIIKAKKGLDQKIKVCMSDEVSIYKDSDVKNSAL